MRLRIFTVKGLEEYLDRASDDEARVACMLNALTYYDSPCGSSAGWSIEEEGIVEDVERLAVSGSGDKSEDEDDDTTWKEDINDDGAEYFTLLMRAVMDARDHGHDEDDEDHQDQDQSHCRDEAVALELVHYMLARGADPNVSTILGTTTLMLACEVLETHTL
jgi:hypothetical protein